MKGRTFKLCVLTRWDFNFCVRSSPLRGRERERERERERAYVSVANVTPHVKGREARSKWRYRGGSWGVGVGWGDFLNWAALQPDVAGNWM